MKKVKHKKTRTSYRDSHLYEFRELQQKVLGDTRGENITTIDRVFAALGSRLRIEAEKDRKLRRKMHEITTQFDKEERRCRNRLRHALQPISQYRQTTWGRQEAEVMYACRLWEMLEDLKSVEKVDFSKHSRKIIQQEIQPLVRNQLS